jgi:hypothetical protein
MPAHAVTVTAKWTYTGGGGGDDTPSSPGGTPNKPATPNSVVTPPVTQTTPDNPAQTPETAPVDAAQPAPAQERGSITRTDLNYISGPDRVTTAVTISQVFWPNGSEYVIIAPGADANLIDVAGSASLAGYWNCPTLLTVNQQISENVFAEISRLGAQHIAVVGAVSAAEVAALRASYPNAEILLLQGRDRYETISLINAQIPDPQGIVYIGADAVADAVSLGAWVAANRYIFELAQPDSTVATDRLRPDLNQLILGGPTLVQDIPGAQRIYGTDRYGTNLRIHEQPEINYNYNTVYITNGDTLADGITGAAAAAQTGSCIILAPGGDPAGVNFGNKITSETKLQAFGGE